MKLQLNAIVCGIVVLFAGGAQAAEANWDGTWSGSLGKGKPWPVTIVIAQGKVVGFNESGVPFDVRFSDVTPNGVVFGDGYNYLFELNRRGSNGATGEVHGRLGVGLAHLTRS